MRIFLSFNSRDQSLAEAVRAGLLKVEPTATIFFSPVSLGQGFWLPKLAQGIQNADAFLLLIGPNGAGPWQEVEYHEAFDRHVGDPRFALVPVIVGAGHAPGLPFLRRLNWVELKEVTDAGGLSKIVGRLKGEVGQELTAPWKLVEPYRGLLAMTEANADYFYGRDAETEALLSALAQKPGRLPILIGASGVGKSSVARAGALSALKAMRWPGNDRTGVSRQPWPDAFKDSRTRWAYLTMKPGEDPFAALAQTFARLWIKDPTDPERYRLTRDWAKELKADFTLSDLIEATIERLEAREGTGPDRVLLYIDQGEEIYAGATRAASKEVRRFSDVLAAGLTDKRFIAFASLRADYFDRLQSDTALFGSYEHVDVPPLGKEGLHAVVTGPPKALGVAFEDERTASRITEAPGTLPLLSYLLTDMWSAMVRRGDGTLRLAAEAIDFGGVLAKRAEEYLKQRPDDERRLKRLLTLRLATVPPEGEPLRRVARRSEISRETWAVAERLADYPWRLVEISERGSDVEISAEVAHEALLTAWPRLADWLRDERDFLIFKGEAERAERRWQEMKRDDRALLTGLDLARAEERLSTRSDDLSDVVKSFIRASIALDRATQAKTLQFLRQVTTGAVAAAVAMAALVAFAVWKWDEANTHKRAAQNSQAIAEEKTREALHHQKLAEEKREEASRNLRLAEIWLHITKKSGKDFTVELPERLKTSPKGDVRLLQEMLVQIKPLTQNMSPDREDVFFRDIHVIVSGQIVDLLLKSESVATLVSAAENGDVLAMVATGMLLERASNGFQTGTGTDIDDGAHARSWFERAAAKGNAEAMYRLGLLYSRGRRDLVAAHNWFEKAAKLGSADAMYRLGSFYYLGIGVKREYHLARTWFKEAAERGNVSAMRVMGVMYEEGQGIEISYETSQAWFRKAADKGDAISMRYIGVQYENGNGVEKSFEIARVWYQKAADKGDAVSMRYVGEHFENGSGVEKSYDTARTWYTRAAEAGDRKASGLVKRLAIRQAAATSRHAEAFSLQRELASDIEEREVAEKGKPDTETAAQLVSVAWYALFTREFAVALAASERSLILRPGSLPAKTNSAHALMFLDRIEEARDLYLLHKGKPIALGDKRLWEQVIGEDFAKLSKAGITHPLMAEIEAALGIKAP